MDDQQSPLLQLHGILKRGDRGQLQQLLAPAVRALADVVVEHADEAVRAAAVQVVAGAAGSKESTKKTKEIIIFLIKDTGKSEEYAS